MRARSPGVSEVGYLGRIGASRAARMTPAARKSAYAEPAQASDESFASIP